jgi:predicted acylesterase/phospholipase RssA
MLLPRASVVARLGATPASQPEELDILRAKVRPFEEAELALVRTVVRAAPWIAEPDENAVRYALNLARVTRVRTPDATDVDLETFLEPYRDEVLAAVTPLLLRQAGVDKEAVVRVAPHLAARARAWRSRVTEAFGAGLPVGALDREVCEKALVLVCGGGGGVSYVYLGAFALLEQYGLTPRLLAGTSMGAVLQLFRARRIRYQLDDIAEVVKKLSFRTLFRFLQTESRYGLPAAMRLYLRQAIGEFLEGPDGHPLTLDQLAIPLLVTVTGVRNGALPHDPSYYEHLLDLHGRAPSPNVVKRMVNEMLTAIGELIQQHDRFARLYLGADPDTRAFDAIDAVGFSSALPGVVHYDVLRDDDRMHTMLQALFQKHGLFRLVDGGLVDNLPARTAWAYAQKGTLGTRNAFVLALDGFAPKLTQPLWFGLEQLAAQNVARNQPFIHVQKSFQRVLSPVEIVPSQFHLQRAIQAGKEELLPDMPLVARMCRPFPALT